jgi:protein-disulfide isomerase
MRSFISGVFTLFAWSALVAAQTPPAAAPRKTALDKAAFETYVRHLFVWGAPILVKIDDPKPSQLPGFVDVKVVASAGNATQEVTFYVSKDGRKIVRGEVFDVANNPFKPDLDKLKTQFEPSFGTPGATVVVVVFSDFQCPYCRDEAKMLRENILSAYPKQVRVYFKEFPLDAIHPWARMAAIAGRCVFRQNAASFWDYHDWIFDKQGEITPENLKAKALEFAASKKLDTLQLGSCMDTRATEADVNRTSAEARALGVNSLPTLFINGRKISAQIAWPNLRQIIDYEIDYQKTAKNAGEDCGCEIKLPSPLPN